MLVLRSLHCRSCFGLLASYRPAVLCRTAAASAFKEQRNPTRQHHTVSALCRGPRQPVPCLHGCGTQPPAIPYPYRGDRPAARVEQSAPNWASPDSSCCESCTARDVRTHQSCRDRKQAGDVAPRIPPVLQACPHHGLLLLPRPFRRHHGTCVLSVPGVDSRAGQELAMATIRHSHFCGGIDGRCSEQITRRRDDHPGHRSGRMDMGIRPVAPKGPLVLAPDERINRSARHHCVLSAGGCIYPPLHELCRMEGNKREHRSAE